MERRGVSPPPAALATAQEYMRSSPAPELALPAQSFEIVTTVAPAESGPVEYEASAAPPGEPELRYEPVAAFQFDWSLPEAMEPQWAGGLELASSEQALLTLLGGSEDAVEPAEAAATVLPEPEPIAEPEPVDDPEPTQAAVELSRSLSPLTAATPEPVIDDALLFSLFGRDEETAPVEAKPAVAQKPAAVVTPEVTPVVTTDVAEPTSVKAVLAVADNAAEPVPHEPGSFLPVAIRPAGAPNKTKLMQSFQAIALVSANPQIPVWNMLPLRPRMALGRGPGPGAGLVDRGKSESGGPQEARKPVGAAVEVANEQEPSDDRSVPTFGVSAKPRSGLSRWFKMGILAGVLGVAGGLFQPPEVRATAETRQYMTTEFAVCRN